MDYTSPSAGDLSTQTLADPPNSDRQMSTLLLAILLAPLSGKGLGLRDTPKYQKNSLHSAVFTKADLVNQTVTFKYLQPLSKAGLLSPVGQFIIVPDEKLPKQDTSSTRASFPRHMPEKHKLDFSEDICSAGLRDKDL